MIRHLIALLALTASTAAASPTAVEALQARVDAALAEHPECGGLTIAVIDGGSPWGVAATPEGTPADALTIDTPLRIASNTKTYVAAATLRLVERGALDLDAPLDTVVDPDLLAPLDAAGYATDAITVRHLLMHAGGLRDHADMEYVNRVLQQPDHVWTRREQVAFMAAKGEPLGAPGTVHQYSDTDYVLLGDVLERLTGKTLAAVVREELDFEGRGLHSTWWEIGEPAPADAAPLAAQTFLGRSLAGIDGSADGYGGGGLMASVADMARFVDALFHDRVFDDPATLELMRTAPGQPDPSQYRIGLSSWNLGGHATLGHAGFWGTMAVYAPDLDVTVTGAALDPDGFDTVVRLIVETLEDLAGRED